jgi:hypothetical protein
MSDLEKAISDLQHFRKTHVDWAEHFEKHPELEQQYIAKGEWDDAKEHRRIVACYDNVLACLDEYQNVFKGSVFCILLLYGSLVVLIIGYLICR